MHGEEEKDEGALKDYHTRLRAVHNLNVKNESWAAFEGLLK